MPARINNFQVSESKDVLASYPLISKNGFLPVKQPLKRLPNTYYQQWEQIMDELPILLKAKTIRKRVDNLEILTTDRLSTEREWQRAYVILCFLTHGYIWGGDVPSEIIPPSITIPFLQVSDHLDLPPVATYAALNLWNFSSAGNDFTDLDRLKALHTFTGTEDESWFYVLSVAVEARGASIIAQMLQAIYAIRDNDSEIVIRALNDMAICIRELTQLLGRMSEKCDPMIFYHRIRPFLAGTKNMGAAGLPNGVFYDEGDGVGHWKQLRGGSNGQSSLIQFFDLILGIDHTSTSNHSNGLSGAVKSEFRELSFHEEVRLYMPGPHRKFLASVSRLDKIKDFVYSTPSPPAQQQLRQSYQNATEAFGDFRQAHMQMVTRYIIVPSRKSCPSSSSGMNLATASLASNRRITQGLTGTGGTELIPFLKVTRDDTYRAGLTVASRDISVVKPRLPVDIVHEGLTSEANSLIA
ncbi:Indoleamine 2,3-dioxygenase [Xylaria sp. FL0043]|nr:Indoleamine 2,3-dioxygenase [Xylaria sp. FL0043]